jgi:hypothetical protein
VAAPETPLAVVASALDTIERLVILREVEGPSTHVAIVADDLENPEAAQAIGRYLVGVVAGAIGMDAQLCEELLAERPDTRQAVRDHVMGRIGESNTFTDDAGRHFRDRVRNPWIAEGIGHALFTLRRRRECACLTGPVRAVTLPHPDPRRQGLDLIAIYEDDGAPVLAVEEAKASRQYGPARLAEAATFFAGLDRGGRDTEIRYELHALKSLLPDSLLVQIADGFWRDRSCYVPLIVHGAPLNERSDHHGLRELKPPPERRRLLALHLEAFHEFFNFVADATRTALDKVVP